MAVVEDGWLSTGNKEAEFSIIGITQKITDKVALYIGYLR